jgi:hypothetical protein
MIDNTAQALVVCDAPGRLKFTSSQGDVRYGNCPSWIPVGTILSLPYQCDDAARYRYLRDNNRGLYRVEEERRGYRSTHPDAPRERWFEHVGWCVEGGDEYPTMDEAVDSARGVLNDQDTST